MLILIAILLALVPAVAILYPILRGAEPDSRPSDSADREDLARRWQEALAGLNNADLEHSLGNVDDEDYAWLRERYMTEAALALKAIEKLDVELPPDEG